MKTKKAPRADLEDKKGLYLEIGFIVILVTSLLAFNLKTYNSSEYVDFHRDVIFEIDDLPDVLPDMPPAPPKQPEIVVTDINRVDNNVEVEDIIVNVDDNANLAQEEYAPLVLPEDEEVIEEMIFTVVENEPEFPGGLEALYKYFAENIKYPQVAKENGITGKVHVTFVVEKDGSIANPKVLRDIGGGCGQEAIRVVKAMPKWKPGRQHGNAVRVQFNLPISFNLQ